MRISDWSSDVCSSDLRQTRATARTWRRTPPCGLPTTPLRPCRRDCSASWNLSLLVPQLGGVENVELRARRGLRVGTARKRMPHRRWPAHGPWPPRQHLMAVRVHRSCRSEEHTSELQSLMRISYAVFCLKQKNKQQ